MPTLGQYTLGELKSAIDLAITNKTTTKSITPQIDGGVRKEVVEDLYLKIQSLEGLTFETPNLKLAASEIEVAPGTIVELISIGDNPLPTTLDNNVKSIGVLKVAGYGKIYQLGSYNQGFRYFLPDEGNPQSFLTGLQDTEIIEEHESRLLYVDKLTGEISYFTFEFLNYLVEGWSGGNRSFGAITYEDINSASASSTITLNFTGNNYLATKNIINLKLDINDGFNISEIITAVIKLPTSTTTIDILPYLDSTGSFSLPINFPQQLLNSDAPIQLEIGFNTTNPQNYTGGSISLEAFYTQIGTL